MTSVGSLRRLTSFRSLSVYSQCVTIMAHDNRSQSSVFYLCGVPLAPASSPQAAVEAMIRHLCSGARGVMHVATVNAEMLVRAHRDRRYRAALAAATLHTVDGTGVCLALRRRYGARMQRCTGADLTDMLLAYAERHALRVYCALRCDGFSDSAAVARALRERYPRLRATIQAYDDICAATSRPPSEAIWDADIVLCGFGAPAQEYFVRNIAQNAPAAHRSVGVGVGGTFDFLTRRVRRAPVWMRRVGMEWLWRLLCQPRRWRRIITATIIFPCIVAFGADRDDARR